MERGDGVRGPGGGGRRGGGAGAAGVERVRERDAGGGGMRRRDHVRVGAADDGSGWGAQYGGGRGGAGAGDGGVRRAGRGVRVAGWLCGSEFSVQGVSLLVSSPSLSIRVSIFFLSAPIPFGVERP